MPGQIRLAAAAALPHPRGAQGGVVPFMVIGRVSLHAGAFGVVDCLPVNAPIHAYLPSQRKYAFVITDGEVLVIASFHVSETMTWLWTRKIEE